MAMRDIHAPGEAAAATEPPSSRSRPVAVGTRYTLMRNVIAVVTWGFVAAVVLQIYLAGIGVFKSDFELHRNFGHLLEIVSIGVLILLLIVRATRIQIGLAALLVVLVVAQNVFIAVRTSNPEIAALHPVNAVAILVASIVLARTVWRLGGFTTL